MSLIKATNTKAGKAKSSYIGKKKKTIGDRNQGFGVVGPSATKEIIYGRPSDLTEGLRQGAESGNMWMLLQGAFIDDWAKNKAAQKESVSKGCVSPQPTKASQGHAQGALCTMQELHRRDHPSKNLFKMPRFKQIPCKVQMNRTPAFGQQ